MIKLHDDRAPVWVNEAFIMMVGFSERGSVLLLSPDHRVTVDENPNQVLALMAPIRK